MKKLLDITLVVAFAVSIVSCINEEIADNGAVGELDYSTLRLVSHNPMTKITVSDKDQENNFYKFNWSAEDALGIFASKTQNSKAEITEAESGVFEAPALVSEGESVNIYYPYKDAASVEGGIMTSELAPEQIQSILGESAGMFSNGFAYAVGTVSDGQVDFSLEHPLAYFKVDVSSSALASYKVVSLCLVDKSASPKPLSGEFKFDWSTSSLEPTENAKPWVQLNVSSPKPLSDGSQTFWFSSFPADFAGSEVWLALNLYEDATATSVTLPLKFSNVNLKGGCINEIVLKDLTLNDNDASQWFESVETRGYSCLGYAYGDANTYIIQCKNGLTITNATYTPNNEYPGSVTISTKARGDFRKVVDPRGASFEWAKVGVAGENGNGTGSNTYTCAVYNYKSNDIKPTGYKIKTSENAEVTIENSYAIAGSPILLMIKDNKILWSWTFWNIAADGTTLQAVGKYSLANMDIGQATTNIEIWTKNNRADGNVDVAYRTINYYVWGRPMPIFYANDAKPCEYYGVYTKGSVPGVPGPLSVEESIAHPVGIIYKESDKTGTPILQWQTDEVGDLWGCVSSKADAVGKKTIFDPCPKGWRVADQISYTDVLNDSSRQFDSTNKGRYGVRADGNFFIACGRYANNMQLASNGTDYYWKTESTGVNGVTSYGVRWTNRIGGATMNQPYEFHFTVDGNTFAMKQLNRAFAAPVRCQKDTDNR